MTLRPVIVFPALALIVIGCSSEPEPKPDTGAPKVQYKMVPANTGGAASSSAMPAPSTPAPTNSGNPASPGSD